MALVLNDRVKETTTTTGTGTINLAGAATNFETFVAGIGDGNTVYYAIVHQDQPEFEVGLGTVTDATPDTLSRTTILSSSNSDGLVSFSAGTKDVFCTLPASKTVFEDASGNVGALVANGHISTGSNSGRLRAGASNEVELSHDGSHGELDCDTGNFLIDVVGDITLDADGSDIIFADGGTNKGKIALASDILSIVNVTQDADIKFDGLDGSSSITALRLDMSNAGRATFNENVTVGGNLDVSGADVTITANIIHAGDSDTFFGFNDADTFRITTGGSEALE